MLEIWLYQVGTVFLAVALVCTPFPGEWLQAAGYLTVLLVFWKRFKAVCATGNESEPSTIQAKNNNDKTIGPSPTIDSESPPKTKETAKLISYAFWRIQRAIEA
jgi:hypothetical protein